MEQLSLFSLTKYMLNLFNIDFNQFQISNQAILFQALSALLAPLLAGLPAIIKGARITVREAIAGTDLAELPFGLA